MFQKYIKWELRIWIVHILFTYSCFSKNPYTALTEQEFFLILWEIHFSCFESNSFLKLTIIRLSKKNHNEKVVEYITCCQWYQNKSQLWLEKQGSHLPINCPDHLQEGHIPADYMCIRKILEREEKVSHRSQQQSQ